MGVMALNPTHLTYNQCAARYWIYVEMPSPWSREYLAGVSEEFRQAVEAVGALLGEVAAHDMLREELVQACRLRRWGAYIEGLAHRG